METMQFFRIHDIEEGKRTLLYEPSLCQKREVGGLFGATQWGNLTVLVCEITEVTQVHLLDDLQNKESLRALYLSREDLFQRWAIAFPRIDISTNPLVNRIKFKWTGRKETRQYMSIIEEEDTRCLAELDAAVFAIKSSLVSE